MRDHEELLEGAWIDLAEIDVLLSGWERYIGTGLGT